LYQESLYLEAWSSIWRQKSLRGDVNKCLQRFYLLYFSFYSGLKTHSYDQCCVTIFPFTVRWQEFQQMSHRQQFIYFKIYGEMH